MSNNGKKTNNSLGETMKNKFLLITLCAVSACNLNAKPAMDYACDAYEVVECQLGRAKDKVKQKYADAKEYVRSGEIQEKVINVVHKAGSGVKAGAKYVGSKARDGVCYTAGKVRDGACAVGSRAKKFAQDHPRIVAGTVAVVGCYVCRDAIANGISHGAQSAWEGTKNAGTGAAQWAWNGVSSGASKTWDGVKSGVGYVAKGIGSAAKNAWTGASTRCVDAYATVDGFVRTSCGDACDYVNSYGKTKFILKGLALAQAVRWLKSALIIDRFHSEMYFENGVNDILEQAISNFRAGAPIEAADVSEWVSGKGMEVVRDQVKTLVHPMLAQGYNNQRIIDDLSRDIDKITGSYIPCANAALANVDDWKHKNVHGSHWCKWNAVFLRYGSRSYKRKAIKMIILRAALRMP